MSDKKWEYKLERMESDLTTCQIEIKLDNSGYNGWELCGIEYGCFIFKREVCGDE